MFELCSHDCKGHEKLMIYLHLESMNDTLPEPHVEKRFEDHLKVNGSRQAQSSI